MKIYIRSIAFFLTLGIPTSGITQEVNDDPLNEHWAPSEWGPDDKAGAVNRTPMWPGPSNCVPT